MRKKLFAILMSAMMMVTFMPAMAFAAETPQWAADYSSVTYGGVTYPVVRELNISNARGAHWTGEIKASVDTTKVETVPAAITSKKYYDLSNIEVVGANNTTLLSVMSASTFKIAFPQDVANATMALKFKVPSYVYDYANVKDDVAEVASSSGLSERTIMENWSVSVATPAYDEAKKYEAQSFTLNWDVTNTATAGKEDYQAVVGSLSPMAITVSPETKAVTSMAEEDYVIDTKTAIATGVAYDGAEHVISQKAIPGITSTYEVWKNGAWEAVDAPVVKNVDTYVFRATATDGTTKQKTTLRVTVSPVEAPTVEFGVASAVVPADYQVADFVEINTTDANKKAVAANQELIVEYCKDFYTLTVEQQSKYVENVFVATMALNTEKLDALTTAEKDALVAKYGAMLKNFGVTVTRADVADYNSTTKVLTEGLDLGSQKTCTFTIKAVDNVKENEVEFTVAPTSKTYKAKKLKKAAKSFTVKAEALSGAAVSYKLINATTAKIKIDKTTGKITLKKGLKKGTYKFKVKAYVQAGNGYKAASETQNITVKVKK